MSPRDVRTAEEAKSIVLERDLAYIKIGVFDLDGVMRGKYVSQDKFLSGLETGLGFCDVILGWDVDDQPYDNVTYTGWHTGFPDAKVRIIPESCREIPFEPQQLEEPNLNVVSFDSGRFKSAFRTALKDGE